MKHGMQRAIASMTLGQIRDLEKRRAMLGVDELGEIENQFQLPISGEATATTTWASSVLTFDVHFVMAPEQRDSSLTMPHLTFGSFFGLVDPGDGDDLDVGISVDVSVREWTIDADTGAVTGARVVIGTTGSGTFTGFVHLTFQGYGAPNEVTPDELDVGT
jgi:hypothetical protein